MAEIDVSISETYLDGDYGTEVESVVAECGTCGHETESYGTSKASRRRCLVVMREECPLGEHGWTVTQRMRCLFCAEWTAAPRTDPFRPVGGAAS